MEKVPLSKNALERLNKLRQEGESNSDLILRITNEKNKSYLEKIEHFEGIFDDSDIWEELERLIYDSRLTPRD